MTVSSCTTSRMKVLDVIIEDLCRAASEGVDGVDPYGRRVRIFLDMVTFLADYPEAADFTDVYGHTGNAYCTHCTVSKRTAPTGSKILGTWMNNSRRCGFMRTDARLNSLRDSNLRSTIYERLGIRSKTIEESFKVPVAKLSQNLRATRRPEKDSNGREIAPLLFEPSLSCAVVPDHLLNVLIKDMMRACFKALGTNDRRAMMEKKVAAAARSNGLPVSGYILNWGSKGEYNGLCSHTMTTYLCLLLCAAPLFEQEFIMTKKRVFSLPRLLKDLTSAVYYWPNTRTDGDVNAHMFTAEGRLKYYGELHQGVVQYLQECDKVMGEDNELGAELDKPNAHRALELVVHTIPTFGHARNCSEMVLESMHQVFKGWLEKSAHFNSHISAVERALTRDWAGRVYALFKVWERGRSRERACAENGLRRLLLGEVGIHMDERQAGVTELKHEFVTLLQRALRKPVPEMMAKHSHISLPGATNTVWTVQRAHEIELDDTAHDVQLLRKGWSMVVGKYRLRPGYETSLIKMYKAARLQHVDKYEEKRRSYAFNEIQQGSVISVATNAKGNTITSDLCGQGSLRVYAVVIVLRGPDDKLWVASLRMKKSNALYGSGMCLAGEDCVLIELSDAVRRAGAMHMCDENCIPHPKKLDVTHSNTVLGKGMYVLWTRKDNYPPYMG